MDRILFGDNQFFAVNHMSDEKSRSQAMRFQKLESIIDILDYVYDIGIRTFMCTTHHRIADVCDHIRVNRDRYKGFKIYPCMPYAHKYNNAVAELGVIGALKQMIPGNLVGTMTRGGIALVNKDYLEITRILVDAEMKMFQEIETGVIFLQNVVTDLILGTGMYEFLNVFADYIKEKYNSEPGFITMNFPFLLKVLKERGIDNPIICTSINKIGFRMPGGIDLYEKTISNDSCRVIAMQALAAGAIPPKEAMEYVCQQDGIHSILYGASSKSHILQTKELIDGFSKLDRSQLINA